MSEIVPAMKGVELAVPTTVQDFEGGVRITVNAEDHHPPHFHIMRRDNSLADAYLVPIGEEDDVVAVEFMNRPSRKDKKVTRLPMKWASAPDNHQKLWDEWNKYHSKIGTTSSIGRIEMARKLKRPKPPLPEFTEGVFWRIHPRHPWNNVHIKEIQPLDDLRLHIKWKNGKEDVWDLELTFSRSSNFKLLQDPEFFKKVRLKPGGFFVKWPKKGFTVPADRIWYDCRHQDLYKKPKKGKGGPR